jgi:hypothetical protein
MKRKILAVLIIGCAGILYLSCYKTGEVIYQPECKPDSLNVSVPLYNFSKFTFQNTFNGSLTYDVNRRLVGATTYTGGAPDRQYDFIYDGNNNLVRINGSVYVGNTLTLILYVTFSYPSGTTASLSSTAQVQLHFLSVDNITWATEPVWTYNFNAQYQLVSIFQSNNVQLEQLIYDNGGNCLTDSVYTQSGVLFSYFTYTAYDNQINPARSDRSLQLFFQMYDKNNPTISNEYTLAAGAGQNGFGLFLSSSGSYTYNANGYPITYAGNFFADYNCLPPPNVISAPGPGAN